jgi:hypothetical protein
MMFDKSCAQLFRKYIEEGRYLACAFDQYVVTLDTIVSITVYTNPEDLKVLIKHLGQPTNTVDLRKKIYDIPAWEPEYVAS